MDDDEEIEVHVPDVVRNSLRKTAAMELSTEKMLDRAALLAIGNGQDVDQFLDAARASFNLCLMDVYQRTNSKVKEWTTARREVLAKKQDGGDPTNEPS